MLTSVIATLISVALTPWSPSGGDTHAPEPATPAAPETPAPPPAAAAPPAVVWPAAPPAPVPPAAPPPPPLAIPPSPAPPFAGPVDLATRRDEPPVLVAAGTMSQPRRARTTAAAIEADTRSLTGALRAHRRNCWNGVMRLPAC